MWSDNETERDFLNFSGVSDTIAEIIVQARGRADLDRGFWGLGCRQVLDDQADSGVKSAKF